MKREHSAWAKLTDEKWVALHVPRFKRIQPAYQAYEDFLGTLLKNACGKLAPLGIVNARAKSVPSFAEKILRKRNLYIDLKDPRAPDPLIRMTDLCGGRVIVHTAGEVRSICAFIESAFDIDWANSEDVSQRLKPTEFGYRSVHYIVTVNPGKLRAAGVHLRAPRAIKGLKAEIQVRTLLEHASADIGHDTLYKAGMNVPVAVQRQFAALAAVLEGADHEFGRLLSTLNDLKSNSGAWHKVEEVRHEIARLRIVLKCEPNNLELAVRIGQLALAIGQHQLALTLFSPFRNKRHAAVERVRGLALTEMNWDAPLNQQFTSGIRSLEAACADLPNDAETVCALAECWARRNDDAKAGDLFRRAMAIDPTEPLSVCRFLEFEVARQRNDAVIRLSEPMIRRAMERSLSEIQAGVNLPVAWSTLSVFQLLTGDAFAALHSLAKVMALCDHRARGERAQLCAAGRVLHRTRETVRHLRVIREKIEGFDCYERLLLLALALVENDKSARQELRKLASWGAGQSHFQKNDNVVILSGGCAPEVQQAMTAFQSHLRRAVEGLAFTLVAGGTRMGVSGVAGDVASRSGGRLRAFGYLPSRLPLGMSADRKRYTALFASPARDFTPLDPLQGWTDLASAGVDPSRVKVLGFVAGEISRVEYAVALALGAKVGVIDDARIPSGRKFKDALWEEHPNLVYLPLDAMTLRAFLQMDVEALKEADKRRLEGAAKLAHEDYMRSATPRDPSLQSWERLDENLKLSNYHQVAYWERGLRELGLGVRKLTAAAARRPLLDMASAIGQRGIMRLAEMEHGRWNVERLSYGWRFAEEKDIGRKLSPYLIPWADVPEPIQKYDVDAVHGLPRKLREAGLELYKL